MSWNRSLVTGRVASIVAIACGRLLRRDYCTGIRSILLFVIILMFSPVKAGEIPGLPPALLPLIDRDFALNFSNDFLGRGGSVDDFRTQQTIVTAKLNERWVAVLDHSILTLTNSPTPGRVDQLSASLGYSIWGTADDSGVANVTIGGGIRSSGKYAGERMQNGFHRLISNNIDSLAYVNTDDTDATAWFDANRYRNFAKFDSWKTAYWLRAASLLTTGGQWDSSVSALAVASRGWMDFWLGLRHDWRSGYDADIVQIETARAEEDTAFLFGMRFGAFMLETVQQFNNDASYGQIVLVSSGVRDANQYVSAPEFGIEFGFLLPDVELKLAGKKRFSLLTDANSIWRESAFVDFRYGKPQYEDDDSLFVDAFQVSAGMEWERPVAVGVNWLSYYGALGAGWRNEQLIRDGVGTSEKSQSVGKAVATGAAGVRFFAAAMGESWNYRLQLGLVATLPLGDQSVTLGAESFTLQEPSLGIMLGMTFDRN